MSPVFILSRLCLKRRFQFFGISVEPPRSTTLSQLSTGTLTVISLWRIRMVRYSRSSPSTTLTSFFSTVPAPWWGYTTLSPTSNTPRALPSSGLDMRLTHEKCRLLGAGVCLHSTGSDGPEPAEMHAECALAGPTAVSCSSALLHCAGVRLERLSERLPERLHGDDTRPAACDAASPVRRHDRLDPELRALLEASLRLGGRTQPTGEAELAERCDAFPQRGCASRRRDRERDGQIRAGLVDPHAPGDVDEHVRRAERDAGVAAQHRDDHREPLGVDTRTDPPRHCEIGPGDERLHLEEDRARS